MTQINDIIVVGGGKSIKLGLNLPSNFNLQTVLASKFTILTNFAYKHFSGTFCAFSDREWYLPLHAKKEPNNTPDIYEEIKNLPLLVGLEFNPDLNDYLHPNTIMIPKNKFPSCPLTGIFALHLATLFEPKQIFLLGFDYSRRDPKTIPTGKDYNPKSDLDIHYYKKEIKHRGLGLFGFYENHDPNEYFKYFDNCKSKIYNVNLNSNINNFEKIIYEQMYGLLSLQTFNQEELRSFVKDKLDLLNES
jgi:hypothetical protein